MEKYKYYLTALLVTSITVLKAQVAKIPIAYNDSHIFINVGLGSNDSLRFVFDTGATGMSIDSATAEKAGINKENRQVVNVAGHGGGKNYTMATGQTLSIAGLQLKDVNPVLVDFSGMTKSTGMKLDGLVGYELLNKYVTGIA